MLRLVLALLLTVASLWPLVGAAFAADTYVRGYTRKDGTYVQPHYRSAPDGNRLNNWSTQGNMNPYTGQPGTRSPDSFSNPGSGLYGTQPYNLDTNPYQQRRR
jgi:hypothetical protein